MPELQTRARELTAEFRAVVAKVGLLDTILPPVLFLFLNGLAGFQAALYGAIGMAVLIAGLRLKRRQSLLYALGGLTSTALAIALADLLGRSEGYFLPGIINGGVTMTLALISLIIRRPMVAWTSYVARRWPLDWYWHSRVRPAYTEVTLAWVFFFALRLFWQVSLFEEKAAGQLALVNVLTGWPATIVLLVLSYLYGTWRLSNLGGPSVEEFRKQIPPPWTGQRQGF